MALTRAIINNRRRH
uniref:Uncharacterized protein n=1 Tax=Anguilla anguilla TaxID=7936 RepID=A0A0E9VK89_ANGAN